MKNTYTPLTGNIIDLSRFSPHESSAANTLIGLAQQKERYTQHTIQRLGQCFRTALLEFAAIPDIHEETAPAPALLEIAHDVWLRIVATSGLHEDRVDPDADPSWNRGIFVHHIGIEANDPKKTFQYFGSLLETFDFAQAAVELRAEHETHGRTLHGHFAAPAAMCTAVIRLAHLEEPSSNGVLVSAFRRGFTNTFGKKHTSPFKIVDTTELHAQGRKESAHLRELYGECVGDIVEGSTSLGSYYGWRMSSGGRK